MNLIYTSEEDPLSLKEATSSLDADLWQEAINGEMDSLYFKHDTWLTWLIVAN